jgi:hypothetical protein
MNDPAEGLQFRTKKLGEGSEQTPPHAPRPKAATPSSPTTPELVQPLHVRGVLARIRARVRKWLQERDRDSTQD